MPISASNYDGTQNYNVAEMSDLAKANLLINADFRSGIINQQGKTSYTSVSGKDIYGIDMWKIVDNTSNKVDIYDGHVTFTIGNGSSINQFVYAVDENESYTFAIKLKSSEVKVVHLTPNDATGTLIQNNIYVVLRSFSTDADFQLYFANRSGNVVTLDIEYIKLEEGSNFTGMPSWNEAIELLKCENKQYVIKAFTNDLPARFDGTNCVVNIPLPTKMAKKPSVSNVNMTFSTYDDSAGRYQGSATVLFYGNFLQLTFKSSIKRQPALAVLSADLIIDSNDY